VSDFEPAILQKSLEQVFKEKGPIISDVWIVPHSGAASVEFHLAWRYGVELL